MIDPEIEKLREMTYDGMTGYAEMFDFQKKAPTELQFQVYELLDNGENEKAWDIISNFLQGKSTDIPDIKENSLDMYMKEVIKQIINGKQ